MLDGAAGQELMRIVDLMEEPRCVDLAMHRLHPLMAVLAKRAAHRGQVGSGSCRFSGPSRSLPEVLCASEVLQLDVLRLV